MKYLLAILLFAVPAQADEGTTAKPEPVEVKQECLAPDAVSSNSSRSPTKTQSAQYQPPLCCCPTPLGGITCSYKPACFCF